MIWNLLSYVLPFASSRKEDGDESSPSFSRANIIISNNSQQSNARPPMKWYANPRFAIVGGFIEIIILFLFLRWINVVEGEFFRLGPPVQLFQFKVTEMSAYLGALFIIFTHQLIYTWISDVMQPWVLNEVQDPKSRRLTFSKGTTLVLVNCYYAYFTLNSFLVVNVSLSQVSFLLAVLCADLIATTSVNWHYIRTKQQRKRIKPATVSCEACIELQNLTQTSENPLASSDCSISEEEMVALV